MKTKAQLTLIFLIIFASIPTLLFANSKKILVHFDNKKGISTKSKTHITSKIIKELRSLGLSYTNVNTYKLPKRVRATMSKKDWFLSKRRLNYVFKTSGASDILVIKFVKYENKVIFALKRIEKYDVYGGKSNFVQEANKIVSKHEIRKLPMLGSSLKEIFQEQDTYEPAITKKERTETKWQSIPSSTTRQKQNHIEKLYEKEGADRKYNQLFAKKILNWHTPSYSNYNVAGGKVDLTRIMTEKEEPTIKITKEKKAWFKRFWPNAILGILVTGGLAYYFTAQFLINSNDKYENIYVHTH